MVLFKTRKQKHIIEDEIYVLLEHFTDASLKMPMYRIHDLFKCTNCYPLIFGYFLGAMDYIIEYKNIDSIDAKKLFKVYLSTTFTNEDMGNANDLYEMCKDLNTSEKGRKYMFIGRMAFKKWLENQPEIVSDLNRMLYDAYIR
jgi:2-oxoglutarate dehydrogenase complex dehydrogenase (E1) component-like enzyme